MNAEEANKAIALLKATLSKATGKVEKMKALRERISSHISRCDIENNVARITVTDLRYWSVTTQTAVERFMSNLVQLKVGKGVDVGLNLQVVHVRTLVESLREQMMILNEGLDQIDRATEHRLVFVDSEDLESLRALGNELIHEQAKAS